MKILLLSIVICLINLPFGKKAIVADKLLIIADSSRPEDLQINTNLLRSDKTVQNALLSAAETDLLQEGDLLLRKGYGWISDRIADVLDEKIRITHCGLILREGYKEPHVLHCLSNNYVDGVFVEPLKNYLKESQRGSLIGIRTKGSETERKNIVLESMRLLSKKIPFDLAFNDADTSRMYCAELFGYVFKNVCQRDLLPEKINLFGMNATRMRNFLNKDEFEILFNQFDKP